MKPREALVQIDRIAQCTLHVIDYGLGEYRRFPNMPVEAGLKRSLERYLDKVDTEDMCESDYWVRRMEGSLFRANHAAFLYLSEHGENDDIESVPAINARNCVPLEVIPLLVGWSDGVFKRENYEMRSFDDDFGGC